MADHDDDPGSRSDYSDATSAPPPLRALGRTYHHSGKILQPNDAAEADRYALQHELFRLALGGGGGCGGGGGGDLTAVRLPRDRPVRILDVGTGSGQWAVEMGAAYPLAEVVGVDISPCLLPSAVPRNVSFQVEDVDCPDADEDRHRAGTLDLVHVRSIEVGGIADWVAFLRRAHAWLRPGGQIEVSSIWLGWADNPEAAMDLGRARERPDPLLQQQPPQPQIDPDRDGHDGAGGKSDLTKLMDLYAAAADRLAVHPQPQACVPRWLSEVGFERVVEVRDVVPAAGPGNDESSRAKAAILAELTAPIHFEAHSLRMLVLAGCEERRGRDVIRRAALDSLVPDRAVYGAVKFITARKPDRPSG